MSYIYTDIVQHERLMNKLHSYGVCGNVRRWVSCFLHDRKQRASLKGHTSRWSPITSGIPQRSVHGAVLFVVIILIILIEFNTAPTGVTGVRDVALFIIS